MSNFYTDNQDLMFTLEHIKLDDILNLMEDGFSKCEQYDTAPESFDDAMDNFKKIMEIVGEVAGERIAPRASQIDREGPKFENGNVSYHPLTELNLQDLKKTGLFGVILPREYGGLHFPLTVYTMMTEMVSRADASLQNLFGLQDIAATICEFGSEEQKQRYLPRFVSGEVDGSMDLTEPDSGSDLQSVRLKATQDENGQWYLDGVKRFITNGCSKVHLVLARSEKNTTDGRGLSMFICEKTPDLVVRNIEDKMGIHGVPTCELQFNHVPAELCGMRKRGLIKYVMSLMNGARISISAQAVGIAEAAYQEARKYASERQQFKQTIDKFPPVYDMLAKMRAALSASRAVLYETTRNVDLRTAYTEKNDNMNPPSLELRNKVKYYTALTDTLTPISKALSTETANMVAYYGIQIHGGSGYMRDFNAERYYRDARITNIYEGTTQLQIVAAIGGVMSQNIAPLLDELMEKIPEQPTFSTYKTIIRNLREKQKIAVEFVLGISEKTPDYRNLYAKNLVENETYILASLLLLRDSVMDEKRLPIAEYYIQNAEQDFNRNHQIVMNGNCFLLNNHESIISY